MSRRRVYISHVHPTNSVILVRRPYGFGYFLFDCFMTVITSGLWLIWVVIRAVR